MNPILETLAGPSGQFSYQVKPAEMLATALETYRGALNASGMGIGKTHMSLAAVLLTGRPLAVVCPKPCVAGWERAAAHFHVKPIFIGGYEEVKRGSRHFNRTGWHLPEGAVTIFDEAHACKGGEETENGRMLASAWSSGIHILMLSATIAENPSEMWSSGQVLGLHDGSKSGFDSWVRSMGCQWDDERNRWYFPADQRHRLKDIQSHIFNGNPPRGIRISVEALGDAFPSSDIRCLPVELPEEARGIGLVNPFLVPNFGEREGQAPRAHEVDSPLPAVTSHGAGSLVEPYIIPIDHTGSGNTPSNSIDQPLTTVTTEARHGIVHPFLVEFRGTGESQVMSSGKSVDEPLSVIATSGGHHSVVDPYLIEVAHGDGCGRGNGSREKSLDNPIGTLPCTNRFAIIEPHLLGQQSCSALRPISEPAPTIATAGAIALVSPFLTKYNGTGGANSIEEPLNTVTTKDRFALVMPTVVIDGQAYRVRLRWRMLQPHELAQGQSFPKGYKFTGTKTDAVKQIGNAVPPQLAAALLACHL